MVNNVIKIKVNEQSPIMLQKLQIALEIQVLDWDKHQNEAVLNRLMGFWILNGVLLVSIKWISKRKFLRFIHLHVHIVP
jgi:hypothetical protein